MAWVNKIAFDLNVNKHHFSSLILRIIKKILKYRCTMLIICYHNSGLLNVDLAINQWNGWYGIRGKIIRMHDMMTKIKRRRGLGGIDFEFAIPSV